MRILVAGWLLPIVACGGNASGTATLLNGATTVGAPSPRAQPRAAPVAENGCWLLSPSKLTVTISEIQFEGDRADVSCPVTYDSSQPGMAQLGDCPFTVPSGTYKSLAIGFDGTVTVLIDDPVSGFYSTPSGVQTSPPAGGAQPFTYTHSGPHGGSPIQLPQALTVADGDHVAIDVVLDALQSMFVTVNGGTVTPGCLPGNPDLGVPDFVASVAVAKDKFYVPQSLNTAGSYCAGGCAQPVSGVSGVSVYYTSPTTVAMVGMRLNGTPMNCGPIGAASFINDPRGYVGLDSTGTVGWAIADANWSPYTGELAMPQASAIGSTTTLYCKLISSDPAPPGGSFASGAPGIQTPDNSLGTYVLVAE